MGFFLKIKRNGIFQLLYCKLVSLYLRLRAKWLNSQLADSVFVSCVGQYYGFKIADDLLFGEGVLFFFLPPPTR